MVVVAVEASAGNNVLPVSTLLRPVVMVVVLTCCRCCCCGRIGEWPGWGGHFYRREQRMLLLLLRRWRTVEQAAWCGRREGAQRRFVVGSERNRSLVEGFAFLAQTSSYEDTRNNAKCRSFLNNHRIDTIQLPFSNSKARKNYAKRANLSSTTGRDFPFSFVFKNSTCLQ